MQSIFMIVDEIVRIAHH